MKKNEIRHFIALLCALLIIIRAIFPHIRIDEVSLWFFAIGAILLVIPDIGDLISRLKKVKKGDWELEFDSRLERLKIKTDEAEELVETEELHFGEIPKEVILRINQSLVEPRAALISIAVEIEERLNHLAKKNDLKLKGRYFSPQRILEGLIEARQLDPYVRTLFIEFWAIRNEAVHGQFKFSDDEHLFKLVDLGIRILKFIYADKH